MGIFLGVLGIHLAEILIIAFFLLIRKNRKLEQIAISQQQQIDAISVLIGKMDESFQQLNSKMWIGEDEELGAVFNEMKEIQEVLSSLK
jgi:hypothetical protein